MPKAFRGTCSRSGNNGIGTKGPRVQWTLGSPSCESHGNPLQQRINFRPNSIHDFLHSVFLAVHRNDRVFTR